ncbi:MAG: PilC/PilY family type IV pilus protein [Pseudomonadota bacterium]
MTPTPSRQTPLLSILRRAALYGALGIFTTLNAAAGETDLADKPLANATTVDILPNIFFILDDSGSMDWDYMPDYVNDSYCRDNDGTTASCQNGDAPYYASGFNRVYYNPLFTYAPPVNADGSSKTSYGSPWTAVPRDGYGIQSSSTTNLVSNYPERMACKNSGDDPNGANCKSQLNSSNQYVYPDSTYDNWVTRYGNPFYYNVTVEWCSARNTTGTDKNFGKAGTCQTLKTSTYKYVRYSNWSRVDIIPSVNSYPGPNGTTRTYEEEMTNFANWYAWYRTRMQMAKSGIGRAFADVRGTPDSSDPTDQDKLHARVGFTTINNTGTSDGSEFLAIANFDSGQKSTWYSRLYAIDPGSGTPLLGALSKAGRIYAGKIGTDPVQYSCQRNFSILTSDGYWNSVTSSYGPDKEDGSTNVGDQDGAADKPSYDKLAKADTLADVAYYYYHTDLRPTMDNNVTPTGSDEKVDDTATHQHMTTFTIGLGVDGSLAYQDGYKTSTSGDYYDIKQGTKYWPDPTDTENEERIDDLWHAAVNGRGTYFSARDPDSLIAGLQSALGAAEQTTGSGAAAATSNLQPTSGDNYIYIANYRTLVWDGELSAYSIDLASGAISEDPVWQAASLLDAKIASSGDSDSRTIYTTSGATLKPFTWANLTAAEQAYFDETLLSQYADWTADQQTASTGETMVNFLRGHHRYEDQDRDATFGSYYRLYRDREKTLGDIVHAQPTFVKVPFYNFSDDGYSAYKSSLGSRAGTVYVAANDGMLHAFDESGNERWAFVPPLVLPNMWRLADDAYGNNHRFFVDGPMAVSDAKIGGDWKTILVGSYGKGGRGYYALDITAPDSPVLLWSYTANDNPNIGYTYGTPMITKLNDQWVVLVTSGYNNIPEGADYAGADGGGYLFALDAATGTPVTTWSTGVGSIGNPAGLARINIKVADFEVDNSMVAAYGGDLFGNLWRFDADGSVTKVFTASAGQAITAAPEIGEVDGKTVIYFGTGRYLGEDDLADVTTNAFYAVKDKGTTTSSIANMVSITLGSNNSEVDWAVKDGWYGSLPVGGERVHLNAQLYFGTIVFATTIPTASECQPGGYGRLYFLNYSTGDNIDDNAAYIEYTSPIVGFTVAKLPGGTPKVYPITADGGFPTGEPPTLPISAEGGGGADSGRRVMWRELVN